MKDLMIMFSHRVLQVSDGIHNMGDIRLELLGFLALAWLIVYFCLWKGVATTGKVVYITATLPILLLIIFAIRGATLPGAADGLKFFFLPNWSKVWDPKVWVNAASQVWCHQSTNIYLRISCYVAGVQLGGHCLWFPDCLQ